MGLLSDPTLTPRRNVAKSLSKHSGKICLLFYIAGIAWYFCLALPAFDHATYLSENALSPGLVYAETKLDSSAFAQSLLDQLNAERETHVSSLPHAWISAKMKQIGLETYVHNFTLKFPLSANSYSGKNVYGILRAPGTGSTEGIVFSVPYRPPNSLNVAITPSVPILLAFAEFARRKNYWAKDLIFLVTDQELLGTEAWVKAYYEENFETGEDVILNAGYLPARSGLLQAAVNLEIQDLDFEVLNVKIEGLNGQLPNLDLFNLVQRIASREGISSGYQLYAKKKRRSSQVTYKDNILHMTKMLLSQATGVPTGSHGLFNRYRIEALTLEAIKSSVPSGNKQNLNSLTLSLLKTIEGISRSLNNLLERFHQSFFFYILVQSDKFVSIGDYIPCLCLLVAPNFVKALLIWLTENSPVPEEEEKEKKKKEKKKGKEDELPDILEPKYKKLLNCLGVAISCGFLANVLYWSSYARKLLPSFEIQSENAVATLLLTTFFLALSLPLLIHLDKHEKQLLHAAGMICLGTSLIVVGLLNFALGFLLGILTTPLTFIIQANSDSTLRKYIAKGYLIIINPLMVTYLFVLVATTWHFPELEFVEVATRAITALAYSISYALVDNIIYGTWLFTAIAQVFFPIWTVHWIIINAKSD